MFFDSALQHLLERGVAKGIEAFARDVDVEWVGRAIELHCPATLRRRKLPAESVLWLVLGMALFRDHLIADVVRRLDLVQKDAGGRSQRVVDGALPKARARLGADPIRDVLGATGSHWGHEQAARDAWSGLAVYAMDGTTVSIPDTDANREVYELQPSGRGQPSYPKVRIVARMAARSHLLVDAAFGPLQGRDSSEAGLARPMWDGLPDHSVLLVDRAYHDYGAFWHLTHDGHERHWLTRTRSDLVFEPLEQLGEGDQLVEVPLRRERRRQHPELPATMRVRIIDYEFD